MNVKGLKSMQKTTHYNIVDYYLHQSESKHEALQMEKKIDNKIGKMKVLETQLENL